MKKVYLVTETFNYDDEENTNIVGVFTSPKLAELFINSFSREAGKALEVQTQTINPFKVELSQGLKYYFLRMTKEGKVYDLELSPFAPQEETAPFFNRVGFCVDNHLFCHCFAKDEKDAIRQCNNERLRIISENKWPEPELVN